LADLAAGAAVEVDRTVTAVGTAGLTGHRLQVGSALAGQRVTLRLEEHPIHVVVDGTLRCTLASPAAAGLRRPAARRPPRRPAPEGGGPGGAGAAPGVRSSRSCPHHTGEVRRRKAYGRAGRSAWKVSSII
jgi:hypothetical protein